MSKTEKLTYTPFKRFLLEICFDGSGYSGWQRQPNAVAVQEVIEGILSRLYAGKKISLVGSSRTDAGVHALGFAASFVTPPDPAIPMEKVKGALNKLLPHDIKIMTIREMPLEFHARFDTVGKAYTYVINLGPESPFSSRYCWRLKRKVNLDLISEACSILTGTHDFSSFVVERNKIEDAVRTIYSIDINQFGDYLCLTFVGNGFLYKMIRCLTGAIEACGASYITTAELKTILAKQDRTLAPGTAPACGLFLNKVFYEEDELHKFKLERVPFFR